VDLPIKRISAHARREKSIRHGHISTLHIWWARRPLAACRAVICAALWPDPADPLCPQAFRDAAARIITEFACKVCGQGKIGTANLAATCSEESVKRWEVLAKPGNKLDSKDADHLHVLRFALLDFIADFANWDNSTVSEYLETARAVTQAAHEASGGEPGTRPLVVDPFAGGGSIPLEALRVGADAFASDLNPVAVLLNKVVLEYIPKYGQKLADEVRKWGRWIKEHAEKELATFYPKDPDGATPIAYLWARTIICEGPGCGTKVPLIRSLWLARKGNRAVALRLIPRHKLRRVDFEIIENAKAKDVGDGTVRRGSATCPICGFTTPVASVRRQLKERRGGTTDALLLCVVTTRQGHQGRFYRLSTDRDKHALRKAEEELGHFSPIPTKFRRNLQW
jgi:adenine-specific DNA methylase